VPLEIPPSAPEVVLLDAPLLLLIRPGATALKNRRKVGIDAHMMRRFASMQLLQVLVCQYENSSRYDEVEKEMMLDMKST
jgi:hypothetical protein